MWNVILLLSELVWFRLVNYSHSRNLEGFPHGLFATADSPSQCHRLAFSFVPRHYVAIFVATFHEGQTKCFRKFPERTPICCSKFSKFESQRGTTCSNPKVWIPRNVIQWIPYTKSYHEFLWPYLEAINMCMMLVGRIIAGFSVGLLSGNAPVYTSEIAPPKLRGALVTGFQFAITVRVAQDRFGRWPNSSGVWDWRGVSSLAMMASWYVFLVCWKFWLENIGRSKKGSFLIAMSEEMKAISCNWIRMN